MRLGPNGAAQYIYTSVQGIYTRGGSSANRKQGGEEPANQELVLLAVAG